MCRPLSIGFAIEKPCSPKQWNSGDGSRPITRKEIDARFRLTPFNSLTAFATAPPSTTRRVAAQRIDRPPNDDFRHRPWH